MRQDKIDNLLSVGCNDKKKKKKRDSEGTNDYLVV